MIHSLVEYRDVLDKAGLLCKDTSAGSGESPVTGLTYESKKAETGTLFVCKGAAFKKEYLLEAAERGSIVYVSETDYGISLPMLQVSDIRAAMPYLARLFYRTWADEEMNLMGITGTKGKTTAAYYTRKIFDTAAERCGTSPAAFLTSVETFDGVETISSGITTPESFELYRHFANAFASGIRSIVCEVSSQALKYGRVDGIPFKSAVVMNISKDHISAIEHPDFEDYFASKLKIYGMCENALVNTDSPYYEECMKAASAAERVITFGRDEKAMYRAENVRTGEDCTSFTLVCEGEAYPFTLEMSGEFNVENALAAIALAHLSGIDFAVMQEALKSAAVPGRVEKYATADGRIKAVVDYAHNAYSFRKMFEMARSLWPESRLVTVFGCPGSKAVNRRKDLGETAGKYCDFIYLTADDPAKEELSDICAEVGQYIEKEGCPYVVVPDREDAIRRAVFEAECETAVLILGKGCETTQIEKNGKVPYPSDASVLRDCIAMYNERA
ncbi:MAG: UDP-N-acetylmuramyl-tripeptide synthetase [Eubacterium sp.]|nr:UDP-N-acetylmuramyl-tripeptide synthetase [Eubacterium sp.]